MQRAYTPSEEETITFALAKLNWAVAAFATPEIRRFWQALEERTRSSHLARADVLSGFREGLERAGFATSALLSGYPAEYIAAHCYGAAFATLKNRDTIPPTPAPPQDVVDNLKEELERAVLCDAEAYCRVRSHVMRG